MKSFDRSCRAALLAVMVGLAAACKAPSETPVVVPSPSPSPIKSAEARIAEEEAASQGNDYFDESRTAVRAAARQFVKTELPDWTLKGMASESYEANVFWVDVDLERRKAQEGA